VIVAKEDKPMAHLDVFKKLHLAWKSLGSWKDITLGKSFYEFYFFLSSDMRCVFKFGS